MIRDGSYTELADQMIGEMQDGSHPHGGNFAYLLRYDGLGAARVYQEAAERFGPFATAASFAVQCEWNNDEDARGFVSAYPNWPPQAIAEGLRYL